MLHPQHSFLYFISGAVLTLVMVAILLNVTDLLERENPVAIVPSVTSQPAVMPTPTPAPTSTPTPPISEITVEKEDIHREVQEEGSPPAGGQGNEIEESEPVTETEEGGAVAGEGEPMVEIDEELYILGGIMPTSHVSEVSEVINAVYLTGWSGGNDARITHVISLARNTEVNAVVIDVKDFSGYVSYETSVPATKEYEAEQNKIPDIEGTIKKLHDEGIYVIARITVFQDPVLAVMRPDLAVHSSERMSLVSPVSSEPSLATLWLDNKGLAWTDPSAQEVWKYNVAIAQDASLRGFDEINFDYIRFPSDGDLQDMKFLSLEEGISKRETIRSFFAFLRDQLPDTKISVDVFGLATVNQDDLGIGQVIEDAYTYFDFVSPMVYPSHYADGYLGYENPAEYPYEIIRNSLDVAQLRLSALQQLSGDEVQAKLRPWIQDFDLGAEYTEEMVQKEIRATKDATKEEFAGYMVWNPSNTYVIGAFVEEKTQMP